MAMVVASILVTVFTQIAVVVDTYVVVAVFSSVLVIVWVTVRGEIPIALRCKSSRCLEWKGDQSHHMFKAMLHGASTQRSIRNPVETWCVNII